MRAYKIHFIRHGLTEGNVEGKYIGRTDLPLCEQGIEELEELAIRCLYPNAQRVYASPLERAVESAQILYPDRQLIPVPEFSEYDFGAFEGKSADELIGLDTYKRWLKGDMQDAPPGGESFPAFQARLETGLRRVFQDMMDDQLSDVAVVTHAGVIMQLLAGYGLPKKNPFSWSCEPGRGYTVQLTPYLWQRSGAFEIMGELPYPREEERCLDDYYYTD